MAPIGCPRVMPAIMSLVGLVLASPCHEAQAGPLPGGLQNELQSQRPISGTSC